MNHLSWILVIVVLVIHVVDKLIRNKTAKDIDAWIKAQRKEGNNGRKDM